MFSLGDRRQSSGLCILHKIANSVPGFVLVEHLRFSVPTQLFTLPLTKNNVSENKSLCSDVSIVQYHTRMFSS